MKLMPLSKPGELHIGGVGLAREYIKRPDLTASKFVQSPLGDGRLYKTGDLATYTARGDIVYMGRMDQQVKLRGQRIELGEIESAALEMEQVAEAAAVVHVDHQEQQVLTLYYTPVTAKWRDINAFLRKRVTSYMVPALYIPMTELPRAGTGKLNRTLLGKDRIKPDADGSMVEVNKALSMHGMVEAAAVIYHDGKSVGLVQAVDRACDLQELHNNMLAYSRCKLGPGVVPESYYVLDYIDVKKDGQLNAEWFDSYMYVRDVGPGTATWCVKSLFALNLEHELTNLTELYPIKAFHTVPKILIPDVYKERIRKYGKQLTEENSTRMGRFYTQQHNEWNIGKNV
jgi:hypothetical protein